MCCLKVKRAPSRVMCICKWNDGAKVILFRALQIWYSASSFYLRSWVSSFNRKFKAKIANNGQLTLLGYMRNAFFPRELDNEMRIRPFFPRSFIAHHCCALISCFWPNAAFRGGSRCFAFLIYFFLLKIFERNKLNLDQDHTNIAIVFGPCYIFFKHQTMIYDARKNWAHDKVV